MQTTDSVRSVKGVGEKAEQNLHKLKIETVGELLEHYPRNYDEIKPVCPIEALEEGDIAAVEGGNIYSTISCNMTKQPRCDGAAFSSVVIIF